MEPFNAFQLSTFCQLFLINAAIPMYMLTRAVSPAEAVKTPYWLLNMLSLVCGIPIILMGFTEDLFVRTQLQLALLGAFFAIQILPILFFKHSVDSGNDEHDKSHKRVLPLTQIKRIVLGIYVTSCAIIAYFTAVKGSVSWMKLGVLSCACGLLYVLSGKVLSNGVSNNPDDSVKKARVLLSMIGLLCIYWVLKEVIFATDAHDLRPIMMSVFLQITTLLTLPVLTKELRNKSLTN